MNQQRRHRLRWAGLGGMVAVTVGLALTRSPSRQQPSASGATATAPEAAQATAQAPAQTAVQKATPTPQPSATPVPQSRIAQFELASTVLDGQRVAAVYLPPGYDDPANAARRYPVVYLLHGAPGGYRDWLDAAGLQPTADRLIAEGAIPPLLIVMPDGNYGELGDSQWINGDTAAGFGRVEDFLVQELMPGIDREYRTVPDRADRAIGGLSAGAYGALNLAVRHPDLFATVAVHSGFYRAQPTDSGIDVLDGDPAAQRANSPIDHLDDGAFAGLALYFDVGSEDPWFLDDGKELDDALTARGIPHTFHIFPGSHSWDYWTAHLPDALRFIGGQFKKG